jgi:excisionase family DNA binding protein
MSKQLASSNPPTNFSSQGAFNYSQAAAYAGVKFSAIETVVREGRLPGRRLGRNIIILKSDLDNFLASLDIVSAPTSTSVSERRREGIKGADPSAVPAPAPTIAFDLKRAAAESSCSVWFLRYSIKNGSLRARLAGKKFVILRDHLADFFTDLPAARSGKVRVNTRRDRR